MCCPDCDDFIHLNFISDHACLPYVASSPKVKSELSEKGMFDGIEDTEAYLVANDEFILLVFRGTMEAPDWATNLSFLTRRVPDSWGLDGEGCDVHQVRATTDLTNRLGRIEEHRDSANVLRQNVVQQYLHGTTSSTHASSCLSNICR